jgi:hypothetical protein
MIPIALTTEFALKVGGARGPVPQLRRHLGVRT